MTAAIHDLMDPLGMYALGVVSGLSLALALFAFGYGWRLLREQRQ